MQNVPPPVFLKMIPIKLCFILTKIWIYEILFTFCVIFVLIYCPRRECADLHVMALAYPNPIVSCAFSRPYWLCEKSP